MVREIIILREVSQTKTNIIGFHLYVGSNYVTSEHVYKRETLTDIKNKLMVTKGVRG